MNNITSKQGDLFTSQMQTLTNAVNTVGAMGAGIARQFKDDYPVMFIDYKAKCDDKVVKIGEPYLWQDKDKKQTQWILNFPTKKRWQDKSQILWVEQGLDYIVKHYKVWGVKSLAMPALGGGLGQLDWQEVKTLMEKYLSKVDIPVEIYEPLPQKGKKVRKAANS